VRSLPLGKRSRRSQDPEWGSDWGKCGTQSKKSGAHSDSYTAQSIPTLAFSDVFAAVPLCEKSGRP
jgi:hypothetical protein